MDARQVTDIFIERLLLTPEQAEEYVKLAAKGEKPIEELLVEYQVVDEEGFIRVIADSIGTESYNLQEFAPDTTVLGLIPSGLARLHGAMPVMGSGNTIIVALTDPLNPQTIEDLRFALGREIQVMVAFPARVTALIRQHYGSEVTNFDDIIAQLGAGSDLVVTDGGRDSFNLQAVTAEANTGPIIKYVDLILDKA
ncbi:MAG: pilus assembly protein PilB, partial [Verrucomicrobiota bacterium]